MPILAEWHLRSVLAEYARHCSSHRPHQGLQRKPPQHQPRHAVGITARIESGQVLGGLSSESQSGLADAKRQNVQKTNERADCAFGSALTGPSAHLAQCRQQVQDQPTSSIWNCMDHSVVDPTAA